MNTTLSNSQLTWRPLKGYSCDLLQDMEARDRIVRLDLLDDIAPPVFRDHLEERGGEMCSLLIRFGNHFFVEYLPGGPGLHTHWAFSPRPSDKEVYTHDPSSLERRFRSKGYGCGDSDAWFADWLGFAIGDAKHDYVLCLYGGYRLRPGMRRHDCRNIPLEAFARKAFHSGGSGEQ